MLLDDGMCRMHVVIHAAFGKLSCATFAILVPLISMGFATKLVSLAILEAGQQAGFIPGHHLPDIVNCVSLLESQLARRFALLCIVEQK